MKTLGFLFTGLLMGLTTVAGTNTSNTIYDAHANARYQHAQPILFVERGIEFIVFPNGDFDFNTAWSYGYDDTSYYSNDVYYRTTNNTRRSSTAIRGPRQMDYAYYGPSTAGVQIVRDRFGNIRRVGNVFINYDYFGRVNRIGSVFINYNRHLLVQVGGLRLYYNKHGKLIKTRGQVNRHWNASQAQNYFGWDNNHWYDDSFYYYKKDGKTVKKDKTLNRRTVE